MTNVSTTRRAAGTAVPARGGASRGVVYILGGVSSLQFGAALAATLFSRVGPIAVVMLRLTVAAIVLTAIHRPTLRGRGRRTIAIPVCLGLVMAVMNLSLYEAIDRLPLGVAITLEFLGPVAVALASSRRWIDACLALTAAGGVALLTGGVHDVSVVGVLFALTAAACWSLYIVLNRSLGAQQQDGGLAIAALVAAFALLPLALARVGSGIFHPRVLLIGVAVGVLCSVVPYTTDMAALKRLPVGLFSVMMSIHPATAALAGFVVLGQSLSLAQTAGIGLVILTSASATVLANRRVKAAALAVL
ncbi:MAG TPA: EamA family transporter [Ilumatobacteraceae bacterium]